MNDPYVTLGVPRTADATAIRRAYRRRATKAHPDHGGSVETFAALKRAHDLLLDPVRRARFDETGDFEEATVDNSHAAIIGMASQIIDAALGMLAERGGTIETSDMVRVCLQAVARAKSEVGEQRGKTRKMREVNQKMLGRFIAKEGDDTLNGIVRARLDSLADAEAQSDKIMGQLAKVQAIFERHRYLADEAGADPIMQFLLSGHKVVYAR